MSIISNMQFSPQVIENGGMYVSIFLLVALSISFLISDTKYYNEWIRDILVLCTNPLLLILVMIVIYKIIMII